MNNDKVLIIKLTTHENVFTFFVTTGVQMDNLCPCVHFFYFSNTYKPRPIVFYEIFST